MDTREVILVGGIPAAGKSTLAKSFIGYTIIEFDDWVMETYQRPLHAAVAAYRQDLPSSFNRFLQYAKGKPGNLVICDAWAFRDYRKKAVDMLKVTKIIYIEGELTACLERNRGRTVDNEALISLFFLQEKPTAEECPVVEVWHDISCDH